MTFNWDSSNLSLTLENLRSCSDLNSIGVSEKGLEKVSAFSRFFQWLFSSCMIQQTRSFQVIPRIISLFEKLAKDQNEDLILKHTDLFKKLVARSQKYSHTHPSGDWVNKVLNPKPVEKNDRKSVSKESLIRYASLFPCQGESLIEKIDALTIEALREIDVWLSDLSKGINSNLEEIGIFKINRNRNSHYVEISFSFHLKLANLIHWDLRDIFAGYVLDMFNDPNVGVDRFPPDCHKYKKNGVMIDGSRAVPGHIFITLNCEFIQHPHKGTSWVGGYSTLQWGVEMATIKGIRWVKNPCPQVDE